MLKVSNAISDISNFADFALEEMTKARTYKALITRVWDKLDVHFHECELAPTTSKTPRDSDACRNLLADLNWVRHYRQQAGRHQAMVSRSFEEMQKRVVELGGLREKIGKFEEDFEPPNMGIVEKEFTKSAAARFLSA